MGRVIRETVVAFGSLPVDLQDAANAEGGAWTAEAYTDEVDEQPAINGFCTVASDGRLLVIVKKESDAPVTVVTFDEGDATYAIMQVDDTP